MQGKGVSVLATVAGLILVCTSCGGASGKISQKTVTSIVVTLGLPSIQVANTTSCTTIVTYNDRSTDNNAVCASDAPSIASVASNVVTGVAAGTANITASAGGVTSPKVEITVTAPPISVNGTPSSANVQTSSTQNFTATVANDPNNAGVTWKLSGGCSVAACGTLSSTWTPSGTPVTYTAPANVPNPATVTITATSVTDSSKSWNATITVTSAQAAITSVTPVVVGCNDYHLCGTQTVAISGANFTGSCTVSVTPPPNVASSWVLENSGLINGYLNYDEGSFNPGAVVIQICTGSENTASNKFTFGLKTNRNMLVRDPVTGDLFLLNIYGALNGEGAYTGIVYHFNASGVPLGQWQSSINGELAGGAMAMDDGTRTIAMVQYAMKGIHTTDQTGALVCAVNGNGAWGLDVAAKSGYAIASQPAAGSLLVINLESAGCWEQTPVIYSGLKDPGPVAMVQVGSTLDGLAFDCGSNELLNYSIPNATSPSSLTIAGIKKASSGNTNVQLAALTSGVAAVLSPDDGKVLLVDLGSMTLIDTVPLDGYPDNIIAVEALNAFEISYASTSEAVPTNVELVSAAGGKPTKLALQSATFALGLTVSGDGTTLSVGGRSTVDVQDNH